jgi:hypothetical protein
LTIRLEAVIDKIIHNNQTTFMKGRNIISGLHEFLHETKKRKKVGIILKLDFEKAYNKVNWKLIFYCLEKKEGLG